MHSQQTASFQGAIDVVESLPDYQQEYLLNIIQKRLTEKNVKLWHKIFKKREKNIIEEKLRKALLRI